MKPTYSGPIIITNNTFANDVIGVAARPNDDNSASDLSMVAVHGNTFSGDGEGVYNAPMNDATDSLLNATGNWWGNTSGPQDTVSTDGSIPASNATGTGSPAIGAVDYANWCTNSYCDTTRPTLVYNAPVASSTASSTLPVSVTASDGQSGVASVIVHAYNASGTYLGACGSGASNLGGVASYTYTCTLNVSSYPDGNYTLRSGTDDVAGNNQTVSLPFIVSHEAVANVTTDAANPVGAYDATVNGIDGPVNADNTSFWWGTTPITGMLATGTNPGATEFPASGWMHDNGLGGASANGSFSENLTGLTPGTGYYFVAWAEIGGVWYPGQMLHFTTVSGSAVSVTTNSAIDPTPTTATLEGTDGPVSADNTSFWWGTTPLAETLVSGSNPGSSEFPSSNWMHDNGLGSVSANGSFNESVTGLTPGQTYYFVAWVQVDGIWYPGNVLTFIAPAPSASCPAGTIESSSPLETVTVNSDSATPTFSSSTLSSGQPYLLVSSGVWQNAGSMMVDSAFDSTDNWATYAEGQDAAPYFLGPQETQLQVDNGFVNWGPYDGANHTYSYLYTGNGSQVALGVFDGNSNTATANPSWYGDNVGNLSVSIYACNAPTYVTTDAAGSVTETGAVVNGTNGSFSASDTSFWLGTASSTSFTSTTNPNAELPEWLVRRG